MRFLLLALSALLRLAAATATLPVDKIRGVNLGGLSVGEQWMMHTEWQRMGCHGQKSEFDCIMNNQTAQAGFTSHWRDWITQADLQQIKDYDVASEHFPKGSFPYIRRLCQWAADLGLHVLLDLHGAPGAQQAEQPSTGQYAPSVGFNNNSYNYQRAYNVLKNLTYEVHTDAAFSTVFGIEVLNEPLQSTSKNADVVKRYYPGALAAIRDTESSLGISCAASSSSRMVRRSSTGLDGRATLAGQKDCLTVVYMDYLWWGGNPVSSLPNTNQVAFDDHSYVQYVSNLTQSRAAYLSYSCTHSPALDSRQPALVKPVIVGEWSLATQSAVAEELGTKSDGAREWFTRWAAAQGRAYEEGAGWFWWTWKTDTLKDYRWDYRFAVEAGVLPRVAGNWSDPGC
ncbi:hypothetical protein JCM8097_000826 [Rhodosporidiobolus ruineniae]